MNNVVHKSMYSRDNILLNFFIVLLFLLPQNMVFYLTVPIGMLFLSDFSNVKGQWGGFFFTVITVLLLSILANNNEIWVNTKSILKALQLSVCFLCFGKTKSTVIYKGTLTIIIFYLALFQFAGILHINPIIELTQYLYPLADKHELAFERSLDMSILEMGGFNERLFGIYHNANNCAIYSQILLVMLVIEKEQFMRGRMSKLLYYVLLLTIIVSLMAAGSRTSFIVLVGIGLTMFGSDLKGRIGEVVLIIGLFVAFVSLVGIDLRMFRVGDGMDSSFGVKIGIVEKYWNTNPSFSRILFGCFSTQALITLINTDFAGTDMDLGDMFVQHGIVFLFVVFFFLVKVFKSLKREYKPILWIFLWMLSNTVFCNYRTSSIMLLLLSIYIIRSSKSELNSQI